MEIKVCKTNELSDFELTTYTDSFNAVFDRGFDVAFFKRKYSGTFRNNSYHSLLLNDSGEVVGGCSAMPMQYLKNNQQISIGLAVDVFIREEYRTDPLMLRKLYTNLKKYAENENIIAVIAVPNATSYSYWKNVVKWEDIGLIPYWIIPVKVGNLLKKYPFINPLSSLFFKFWISLNYLFSFLTNSKKKKSLYQPVQNEYFYCKRFEEPCYHKIVKNDIVAYYRVVEEDDVITTYLFEAKAKDNVTFKALAVAVKEIMNKENTDIIMYVGPLRLFQTLFLKVPCKFEPKKLTMTCDFIDKNNKEHFFDMLSYSNWDFGLINYDVR